ncbi:MAG: GNAT family N-acetyltransferase [Rubripirellula sp.]
MLRIEFTDQIRSLLDDVQTWDSLASGVPFREAAWLRPWWDTFGHNLEARILTARDQDNRLRGILPLYVSPAPSQSKTLRLIGDGQACSDYASILVADEDANEVADAMGQFLTECVSDQQFGWDQIDLDGVVEGDPAMAQLGRSLKSGGASLHAQSRMSTWFRPHAGSWDEHLAKHGKTQRRKMRRWLKVLEAGTDVEKVVANTEPQVDEILNRLIDLHQRRWNEAGEAGSYADPTFREFVAKAAKSFSSKQRLYLVGLKHAGEFIGAELNFIGGNRVQYSYSAGYDVDASEFEPGRLLNVDVIQQVYQNDLAGIDYMRGDEEYKKRMATESRRVFHTRVVAPTLLPKLRHAAWCTQFEFGQWMRRRTGRPLIDVIDFTSI